MQLGRKFCRCGSLCNLLSLWVSVKPSEGMEIIAACVALIAWFMIYMHSQRRLARNKGWQEVVRWLARNPTMVDRNFNSGWQEVR